ncbi:MAG: hypothetical protein Q4A50_10060 [Bacteroidales bacterium]|nr:hypothetical protein [Bacteroidales bacterium]
MKKNLLRMVALMTSMVICLGASAIDNVIKKTEMKGEVTSVEALKEATFMLQNEEAKVMYTPSGWDIKVATLIDAVSKNDNGGFYKLESVTIDGVDHFLIPVYNIDKSRRTFWAGNQYVNAQPTGGNVIFGLDGVNAQHGQDGPNLAVWDITYEEGKGFAFHNVGRDIYLGSDDAAARPSEEIKYWKAYTEYIAGYDQTEVETAYALAIEAIKTSDAKAALEAANTAFTTDANLDAYGDAVNAAINVINACEAVNAAYKNLDATGAAVAAEVLAKYNAGDYKDIAELRAAYILAAKAQTAAGAIMTGALVNPSFELGTLDGWTSTDGGAIANNYNFGARTGEKFVERWTNSSNGGKLSDGSLMQTVAGLPNGYYTLTAEMQNLEQGNNSANGKGYYLVANGDSTEVAVAGETVKVTTNVTDGTLAIGAVMKGCTGNWVCVDNFQLTYEGTILKDAWYKEGAFAIVGHDFVEGVKKEFVEPRWVADAEGNAYLEVTSCDNPAQEWDSQIFITLNDELKVGDKVNFSMLVRGTAEGVMSTQTHSAPGSYVGGLWSDINVTTEWTKYENVYTVSNATAKTLVFNLAKAATANNFQFDDIAISIEKAPEFEWVDIIKNGDMEGTDTSCFYKTEATVGPSIAAITAGAGKDGSAGIEVQSADSPTNPWDTQFFIRLPYILPTGTHFLVEFDIKADKAANSTTQGHTEPGSYKGGGMGNPQFTTEWATYSYEGTISADGTYSIAINLAESAAATKYSFDNIKFFVQDNVLPELTASPDLSKKEFSLDVERYPGLGYGAQQAEADIAAIKSFLGVEALTAEMLSIVNPDGTTISDYAPYDGWFAADGAAKAWGDLNPAEGDKEKGICVKFFQALETGSFDICDMNGADVVGTTYTVKYALTANGKTAIYTINVKFVEKPVLDITYADLTNKKDVAVELTSELGKFYEGLTADVDVASILTELGAESLNDVTIYAVQSDGTLDDNYKLGTTDGWRNAAGDWQAYGEALFYVKADFTKESAQIYEVGGMQDKTAEPATYTATYAFVNAANEAVTLKVTLTYPAAEEPEIGTVIHTIDFATQESYPYYVMTAPEGSSFDVIDGALVIENTVEQANFWDLQPFVCDWFSLKAGYDYIVRITMKADTDGSATIGMGTWSASMSKQLEFTAGTEYQKYNVEFPASTVESANNDVHVLFQAGKYVGKVEIAKVEIIEIVPVAIESVETAAPAAQKNGKYMENGKLVIIKNGKKFNAAGQAIK